VSGKVIVFGLVAVLVAGFWYVFARGEGHGVRTRFKEWSPER